MLRLRILPNFNLANEDAGERSFHEFLASFNVIMLTHSTEASHKPSVEMLRSFLAQSRGVDGVSVRGFDIQSQDVFCDRCCGPHVVSQGREIVTVCDSGGLIRRLWSVESDAWILLVNAGRNVLDDGPLAEVERLALQFSLDVALSQRSVARAPPDRKQEGRRGTTA